MKSPYNNVYMPYPSGYGLYTISLNKPVRDYRKTILGNSLIGLVFAIEWMNQIFQSWQQLMIDWRNSIIIYY